MSIAITSKLFQEKMRPGVYDKNKIYTSEDVHRFRYLNGQLQHEGSKMVLSKVCKFTNSRDDTDEVVIWHVKQDNTGAFWELEYVDES